MEEEEGKFAISRVAADRIGTTCAASEFFFLLFFFDKEYLHGALTYLLSLLLLPLLRPATPAAGIRDWSSIIITFQFVLNVREQAIGIYKGGKEEGDLKRRRSE